MLRDIYTTGKSHTARVKVLVMCALCVLVASVGVQLPYALAAPPMIPGNPGVPGLLAQIASLEQQIADLEAQLSIRDAQIADLMAQIAAKDAQIAARDAQITDLLAQVAAKDAQIAAKDALIADLMAQITAKDIQIADLEEQIFFLQTHTLISKTGQTECWDEDGNPIDCAGTGQDGEVQAGVSWPTPRFTDNGNGTVTDNLTGLVWLKDVSCLPRMPWQTALDTVKNLAHGSCSLTDGSNLGDWRLPSVKELQSLVDFSRFNPSLDDSTPFISGGSQVWSSTTVQSAPEHAWYVTFGDGATLQDFRDPEAVLLGGDSKTTFPGVVWPVRD